MHPRIIPSIEQLRQRAAVRALETAYGREAVLAALREETDSLRRRLSPAEGEAVVPAAHTSPEPGAAVAADTPADRPSAESYLERRVAERLQGAFQPSLRRVINATGVVVHTNLGRAPLAAGALERIREVAVGYSNLEYDLAEGGRGRRDVHARQLLARLTGTEAAVVVNNNAAATLLILASLAAGREVLVSRGELVEIGGGFRVPDVMAQSGAILREVGTTNKTRAADYQAAIGDRTGLILRVHRSNFRIEGFTEQPSLDELVALGRAAGVPVVEDLGSGLLEPMLPEPTVRASVTAGVDVICFSGDKLLGGPQAGIIIGRQPLLDRIGRHPLMRALRVDKLTYAALEGTLFEYQAGRAAETVPVARMLSLSADAVRARAAAARDAVGDSQAFSISLCDGESMVGGGSAPGLTLPTCLLALEPRGRSAADLESALRRATPPVIARVENDRVLLDLRTVSPDEDTALVRILGLLGTE